MDNATPFGRPVRGCGVRVQGGLYIECRPSPPGTGKPLDFFLVDPPIPFSPSVKVGLQLVERGGVWHVIDWIGENSYPYATDYLEEVRHFGVSSRCPHGLDLSVLSYKSRILAVHPRAIPANWEEVRSLVVAELPAHHRCPRDKYDKDPSHLPLRPPSAFCIKHLWGLAPADRMQGGVGLRFFPRKIQTMFEYEVGCYPVAPHWQPGIIASFPISNIVIVAPSVRTPEYEALKAAAAAKLEGTGFTLEEVDA